MTAPTFDLTGKVAIVTGGSKGLGRAMALGFAERGADVVVASRKLAPCEEVASEVRALGGRALAVACHVGEWGQCGELVDATVLSNRSSVTPSPFTVVYAAAKAGLNALTKAAAQEFAPRGIRVNAIVCGMFHTDSFHASVPTPELQEGAASRVSLGRIGDADEIVGTALYLATDASSYLTGQCITLDGGGA